MDFASLLSALMMGIVEGLTEFLPISSTGHLILLGEAIGFQGPPGKTFEISIQLGAVLAVIWLFRATLLRIAFGMWKRGSTESTSPSTCCWPSCPPWSSAPRSTGR